ncbi:hypothetical protein WN943_000100 [Citrus x changshan-huyou]
MSANRSCLYYSHISKPKFSFFLKNDTDLIAGTNGKGTGPLPSNLDGSNFSGSGYSGFSYVAYTADVTAKYKSSLSN